MSSHEQFAENLSLHALGALHGEERVALEKHLEQCADCRRELEQSRGDLALLALSVSGPKPPVRSAIVFIPPRPQSGSKKSKTTGFAGGL